ncbi:unnamed protein product [Amoebophrya sp. A25]|nr:unnamed protein product [Amoebophrya sp. A25]|eukprot:GSA25T00019457001.1
MTTTLQDTHCHDVANHMKKTMATFLQASSSSSSMHKRRSGSGDMVHERGFSSGHTANRLPEVELSPSGPRLSTEDERRQARTSAPFNDSEEMPVEPPAKLPKQERRTMRGKNKRVCFFATCSSLLLSASYLSRSAVAAGNPQCMTADAMVGGMRHYILDWDRQLQHAANTSWDCEDFANFMYNSRDRIQQELFHTYSNMTTVPAPAEITEGEDPAKDGATLTNVTEAQLPEGFGEMPWIMSHVNRAASLVSASVHVNSGLGVLRQECFREPAVHLLFFVSLRRVHQLMSNQLKYLWYMMQNTPEMYRGAATQWLMESSQVFRGDLDTTESIFEGWIPPNVTTASEEGVAAREAVAYNKYEKPKVLSIVELLRRQTFKETDFDRELVRATMREIFAKNDLIVELGAGTGDLSRWLNETGWVQAHAYDYSSDVELITFGNVHQLGENVAPSRLGDGDIAYDWILCLSEQCPMMLDTIFKEFEGAKLREFVSKGVIVEKGLDGFSVDASSLTRSAEYSAVYEGRGNLGQKYEVFVHK